MRRTTLQVFLSLIATLAISRTAIAQSSQSDITLDYPGASGTIAYKYDVPDGIVSGTYTDSQGVAHGYTYDIGSGQYSSPISYPGATATYVYDDIASVAVGTYTDSSGHSHGFTYESSTFTYSPPIDYPGATNTTTTSYDPGTRDFSGYITSDSNPSQVTTYQYSYDNGFSTVDPLGAPTVYGYDASGGRLIGSETDSQGRTTGYIYDPQSNSTTTVDPGLGGHVTTYGYDAVNHVAVGTSTAGGDQSPFVTTYTYEPIYNTYHTFTEPRGVTTYGYDVGGGKIVGVYIDANNVEHGFISPLPEPSTLVLLALSAPALWLLKRRRIAR